jgi:YgiT-type zinc finger domain-containing protein
MKLKKCPACGSADLREVTSTFNARVGKKTINIPAVSRQRCASCGEEYFGHEANAVLDGYRKHGNKHVKSAA